MTLAEVNVSRHSLTVCARETVENLLEAAERARGGRLDEALSAAGRHHGTDAYAVAPSARLSDHDFRTGPETIWPCIGAHWESEILTNLEQAGLVECDTVWRENDYESYLDEGRILTAVRVLRRFAVVQVAYRRTHASFFDYPDHWEIVKRTQVVDTGTYVIGEVGDFALSYVGATGFDTACEYGRGVDVDTLTCWAVEQEGFGASRCEAGCNACRARWVAECGSWRFQRDYNAPHGVAEFDFDDAEDHDGHTIACPHCTVGRVGFLVL